MRSRVADKAFGAEAIERFQILFEADQEAADLPLWLKALRRRSLDRIVERGFPLRRDETWKYTRVGDMIEPPYRLGSPPALDDIVVPQAISGQFPAESRIVLYDGVRVPALSTLDAADGVEVSWLEDEIGSDQGIRISSALEQERFAEDAFGLLGSAFTRRGVVVRIAAGADLDRPINIVHLCSANRPDGAAVFIPTRVLVELGPDSRASLSEIVVAAPGLDEGTDQRDVGAPTLVVGLTDAWVAANADLELIRIQDAPLDVQLYSAARVRLERDARLSTFTFASGGRLSRHRVDLALAGEGIEARLDGAYVAGDDQVVDNHTIVGHQQPHARTTQLYKGILAGDANGVFRGTIQVDPIAQKTDAFQLNKSLILSPTAGADAQPQLIIGADDVRCTHGATVGQLEPDELHYLRTRGIPRRLAELMLATGFLDEVLLEVRSADSREFARAVLRRRLETVLAASREAA